MAEAHGCFAVGWVSAGGIVAGAVDRADAGGDPVGRGVGNGAEYGGRGAAGTGAGGLAGAPGPWQRAGDPPWAHA